MLEDPSVPPLAEMIRLDHLVKGLGKRYIWQALRSHQSIDRLLDEVPDDFRNWVLSTVQQLNQAFSEIEQQCLADLDSLPRDVSRKEQVAMVQGFRYPAIVWAILNGRNYAPMIWRKVRPPVGKFQDAQQ